MTDASLMAAVFDKLGQSYTAEETEAILYGFCPHCLPNRIPYRILETVYKPELSMEVHRIKCYDIASCEWETYIPTRRSDNGLENFFHS